MIVVYDPGNGRIQAAYKSDQEPKRGSWVRVYGQKPNFTKGRLVDLNETTPGMTIMDDFDTYLPYAYRMIITPVQTAKRLGENINYSIELVDGNGQRVPWSGSATVTIRFGNNPPVVVQHQMTSGQASDKSFAIPNNWPTKLVDGVTADIPDNVSISAKNNDATIVGEGITVRVTA